jgi:hypothetical protein
VLAILPMQAFGQREHIAIVGLLPLLAVFVARMKGQAADLDGRRRRVWRRPRIVVQTAFCGRNALRGRRARHLFTIGKQPLRRKI